MNDTLATIPEEFAAIAARPEDHSWAGAALLVLLQGRLSPTRVHHLLTGARDLVAASGESADDVLGDPRQWAREQLAEASLAGATFTDDDATSHDITVVGLALATAVALIWGVLSLVKGGWQTSWTLAMVLSPLLLALLTVGSITLRERLVHRFSNAIAMALTLAVVVPLVMSMGWVLISNPVHLGQHSSLWWFAIAGGLAALTWLAGRVLPDPGPRRVASRQLTDDQWLAEARVRLRERGGLREREIATLLDEARLHAQQTGTSLAEEFGNPVGYAGTLPVDERRRARNSSLLWTALAAIWLVIAVTDTSAWTITAAVLIVVGAALQWLGHLRNPGRPTIAE